MSKSKRGFTLVEVLAVMAIVSMTAAMTIPSLLQSRISANEAAAQKHLKTIAVAMADYHFSAMPPAYPSSLDLLLSSGLEETLANGTRSGYTFQLVNTTSWTYRVEATPQVVGVTGNRSFAIEESGEIVEVPAPSDVTGDPTVNVPRNPGAANPL